MSTSGTDFVDEAGRYLQQGPDFEGQIRRLRSYDGVFFTQAGARKLAHYVEREVTRLLAGALRADHAADRTGNARRQCRAGPARAAAACRTDPAAGSVPVGTDQLLGGPDRARPQSTHSRRGPWSRARRSPRPPAAPMILSGRAARSDTNRPRAKRRSHPLHRVKWERPPPLSPRHRSRRSRARFNRPPRRLGAFSDLQMRRASLNRHSH